MSAPHPGRQSPDPETQSDAQIGKVAGGQADAAPSDTHAKDSSEDTKESVLESNPKGVLEDLAHKKVSKGPQTEISKTT
ncbi:hypothetical protein MMC25_004435 [Agyrium rufum]|nr:hypothetical protein [Agyrium rufum]